MNTVIKDSEFSRVSSNVKPDTKNRVTLKRDPQRKDVTYHVYVNKLGQIVLDPQVTIPASEAWLFENAEAIASLRRGLSDAASGKTSRVDFKKL
ncbi:MAG: hypothetical protein FWF18_01285 [Dehalococcoidia bacterium]|nr:hypothetical protein [Dehalococcoidia bacterium]